MSGPIVRKYGFPNFERIFGKREIQHGVEPSQGMAGEAADDLVPDLPHGRGPTDANTASEHNEMASATEFGQAVE